MEHIPGDDFVYKYYTPMGCFSLLIIEILLIDDAPTEHIQGDEFVYKDYTPMGCFSLFIKGEFLLIAAVVGVFTNNSRAACWIPSCRTAAKLK